MTITLNPNSPSTAAVVSVAKSRMTLTKRERKVYAPFIAEHGVTSATVLDFAKAIAALITEPGPATVLKDGKQVRTSYGLAVNAASKGLRENLPEADDAEQTDKPSVLRASLSGEGGGSVVIEPGHPLFEALVKAIRGE